MGDTAAAVAAHVRSNPGCTVREIGDALGLTTKELRSPLQKLMAEGRVKTTGQRRGTRYHPGSGRATRKKAGRKKATRKKAGARKAKRKATRRKKAGARKAKRKASRR